MKKPSKTAAELEASIKVEMEDICDWPTDMTISVQPDGDSWKVKVVQEGSVDDADRREMVEQIAARLNRPEPRPPQDRSVNALGERISLDRATN
jgi:hypothetical protein